MLFSFIYVLRRLFVKPLPGGNGLDVLDSFSAGDAESRATETAPNDASDAFKKLRRETEASERFFMVIFLENHFLLLVRPHGGRVRAERVCSASR